MVPPVDPNLIAACIDEIEAMDWCFDSCASAISACSMLVAGDDTDIALVICQRVQALILALHGHPELLTAYGPQPKDRIPTELRRAAGMAPLSVASSGFDMIALRQAALLVARPRGSA